MVRVWNGNLIEGSAELRSHSAISPVLAPDSTTLPSNPLISRLDTSLSSHDHTSDATGLMGRARSSSMSVLPAAHATIESEEPVDPRKVLTYARTHARRDQYDS